MNDPSSIASTTPPGVLCYGLAEVVNRVQLPRMPTADQPSDVTVDYYRAGGAVPNVAISLAEWGLHSVVAGNLLGEDPYADLIERELGRHPQVERRWLLRSEHVRTPFSRIFVLPDRERAVLRYWRREVRWTEVQPEMLAGVQYLSIDGDPGEAAVRAAELACQHGVVVVTTDVADPDHPLASLSHLIVTSATYLRTRDMPAGGVPALAAAVVKAGAGRLIVTNGSDPVQVWEPDGSRHEFPSFPLPPVDRTGAGDVFKAACLFGMAAGWDLEQFVRFGAAAAALWISQPTPLKRTPRPSDIEELLRARVPRLSVVAAELGAGQRVCPLCQRIVDAAMFERHWAMEAAVVDAIHHNYPGWRRTDGACPRCIHEHKIIADHRRRQSVSFLVEDHPIYGKPDLFVLPTQVRLRANPHFAGCGIVMCLLDSGFYPHPDLTQPANRILDMVDATTDDVVPGADFREPRGVSWHGLMTSAAAAGNGALSDGRYAGIASEARLVLIKISDPRSRVRERDITRGLRWLLAHHQSYGIQIVNLSVGGDRSGFGRRSVIDTLVGQLVARGMVVVAAAGNAGRSDLVPPASAAEAITVGGIDDQNVLDRNRTRMYGSNWGRIPGGDLKPEVVAPSIWLAAPVLPGTTIAEQNLILDRLWRADGEELPSLLASTYQVLDLPAKLLRQPLEAQRKAVRDKMVANKFVTPYYQHVDGTSFAAPIVSSVVAQMLEANPNLSPAQVKQLIIDTAERLANEPEERQGYGVVRPGRAVAAALRLRHGALADAPLSPHVEGEQSNSIMTITTQGGWQSSAISTIGILQPPQCAH